MNPATPSAIVIDTPQGIEAYRLLTLRSALKLECLGMSHSRGFRASVAIRDILKKAGWQTSRNKEQLSIAYADYLRSIGVLSPIVKPVTQS